MFNTHQGEGLPLVGRRYAADDTTCAAADHRSGAPRSRDIVDLYREHERRIHAYCLRHLGDPLDAEDATQETFMRAAARLEGVSGDPAAYLSAIARNVCCDLRAARRRHDQAETTLDGLERADVAPGPEQTTAERSILNGAVHALSRRECALLVHRFAGYSYEETAERLGLTVKVVSVSLVRARQRVRHMAAVGLTAAGSGLGLRRLHECLSRRAAAMADRLRPDGMLTMQQTALAMGSLVLLAVMGPQTGTAPLVLQRPAAVHATRTSDSSVGSIQGHAGTGQTSGGVAGAGGTRRPDAPRAVGAPPPGASPTAVLPLPWFATDQRQVSFDSFTASPSYASDHTVFAAGQITHCSGVECAVIFKSDDGGRSWQRRTYLGGGAYNRGPVVLGPSYPNPALIYAATPEGLQRSDNDGSQFTPVAPAVYATAAPLTGRSGGALILVGSADAPGVTWLYDPQQKLALPGPVIPDHMMAAGMVSLPAEQGVMVIAHATPSASSAGMATPAALVVCAVDGCNRVEGSGLSASGDLALRLSPSFATDHTLAVWSLDTLWISRDGGHSLHPVVHLEGGEVTAVALAPGSTTTPVVTVAERFSTYPNATVRLLTSNDDGTSFTSVGGSTWQSVQQINALAWLPDGHLLAGLVGTNDQSNGIRCSGDGGATWALSC